MSIMSRPFSDRGRDEYDRIFRKKNNGVKADMEGSIVADAVAGMDCGKHECQSWNCCDGKWCIDGYN